MKFSIRDLFLVTVIVALALGWWLDRCRLYAVIKDQREWDLREMEEEFNSLRERQREIDAHPLPGPTVTLPNSPAPPKK